MCVLLFFFFFQAEDGIRDYKVTGVQTCALPIYVGIPCRVSGGEDPHQVLGDPPVAIRQGGWEVRGDDGELVLVHARGKIGRASCRERGWIAGGEVALVKHRSVRRGASYDGTRRQ